MLPVDRVGVLMRFHRNLAASAMALILCSGAVAVAQDPAAVFGTDGDDAIAGSAGPDSIYARGGNDRVNAGGGDDEIDGGAGADAIVGGDGVDAVSYGGAAAVAVTLDGVADDGAAGEGDNVAPDVEDVFTAGGADKLVGSTLQNVLDGGAGDDRIDGGAGRDAVFGGDGDDTIAARDGEVDRIDCGGGNDTAVIDAKDAVSGCEDPVKPPTTLSFRLSKLLPANGRPRFNKLLLSGVMQGSAVVVGCRSGCGSSSRALVRRSSVRTKRGAAQISLPARAPVRTGSTIEVSVTAPGARGRCVIFKIARTKVSRPKGSCRTAARPE